MASMDDGVSHNTGDNSPRVPPKATEAEISLTVQQLFRLFGPTVTTSRTLQGEGCAVACTTQKDRSGHQQLVGIGIEVPTVSPKISGAFVLTALPSNALQQQLFKFLDDAHLRGTPAQDLLADLEKMMSSEKIEWRAKLDNSERFFPDLPPMTPELRDLSSFIREPKASINSFVTTRVANHCYEKMRVEIGREAECLDVTLTSQPIGATEEQLYRRSVQFDEHAISQEEAKELLVTLASELQFVFCHLGPNAIVGTVSPCLAKLQVMLAGGSPEPSAQPWEGAIDPQKSAFIHSYRSGAKLMVEMNENSVLCELSSRSQEPCSRMVMRFSRGDAGRSEWLEKQSEAIYQIKRLASESSVNQIHALEALHKLGPDILHKVPSLGSVVGSSGLAAAKEAMRISDFSCSGQIALRPHEARTLCEGIETVKVALPYRPASRADLTLYHEMTVELHPDESMAITAHNRLGNQLHLHLSPESVKESGGMSAVFVAMVESLHEQAKEGTRVLFDRALRDLLVDPDRDYILGQWQGSGADLPNVENDVAVSSHYHAAGVARWFTEQIGNMAKCKVTTVGDEFAKVQVVFPYAPYALEATLELTTLRQISFVPTAACLDESQRNKGNSYTFTSDVDLFEKGENKWGIFEDFLAYAKEHTNPEGEREKLEETAMFKSLVSGTPGTP